MAVIVKQANVELCRGELHTVGACTVNGVWVDVFSIKTRDGNECAILLDRETRDELLVMWEAFNAAR